MQDNTGRFYEAASFLCERLQAPLKAVSSQTAAIAQEIRLRVNAPLALFTGTEHLFLSQNGMLFKTPPQNALLVSRTDIFESFRSLCGYSLHTHQYEIAQGFIPLAGGHRAGVCGVLSSAGERTGGLREVSSINLRVARQISGVASELARELFSQGPCGVLIAGAPSSGKTTLLRDLTRALSSGECGRYYKVSLIDERGELAAMHAGVPQNDVGVCTEILSGYPKAQGMDIAIRTLSPQFVVCDEIGREDELSAVKTGLYSAVHVITSVHCANEEDLLRREQARRLLATGAFSRVALLFGSERPSQVKKVIALSELTKGSD